MPIIEAAAVPKPARTSHSFEDATTSLTLADLDVMEYATNGVVASTAFDLAAYPLDLIKTRLQMQGVGPAGSAPATSLPQYTSVFGAIGRIVAEERVIGLWRGAAFNIICHIPVQAMHYGLFELVKQTELDCYRRLQNEGVKVPPIDSIEPMMNFTAGAFAELVSGLIWVPVDMVTQRMMVQGPRPSAPNAHQYKSGIEAIRRIARSEGILGLYRGFSANMWCSMPMAGVQFTVYDFVKRKFEERAYWRRVHPLYRTAEVPAIRHGKWQQAEEMPIVHLIAGAVAGFVSAVVSQPFDIAKTRIQVQPLTRLVRLPLGARGSWTLLPVEPKYRGTVHTIRTIVAEEGAKALFKGFNARVLYITPICSMSFAVYEWVKHKSLA